VERVDSSLSPLRPFNLNQQQTDGHAVKDTPLMPHDLNISPVPTTVDKSPLIVLQKPFPLKEGIQASGIPNSSLTQTTIISPFQAFTLNTRPSAPMAETSLMK